MQLHAFEKLKETVLQTVTKGKTWTYENLRDVSLIKAGT